MAGAQIPLGAFDALDADDDLSAVLADAVADRFFGAALDGEPADADKRPHGE
jgi:hypothetical protein